MKPALVATFMLTLSAQQINVVIDDGDGKIPAIRRTDPREEPALAKIVDERSPGVTAAIFSLGYLAKPAPRTREILRDAARSPEIAISYPAICSLWRTDDPEWLKIASTALPKLTRTQQMHIARLLFLAGDYTAWPLLRSQLLDMLAAPDDPGGYLKSDVFGMLNAASNMRDDASGRTTGGSEGAALRDLRAQLAKRPAASRERIAKILDSYIPETLVQ